MPLTLADREEIRGLIARYDFALDLGDPDEYANCFTEDGVFLHTGSGEHSDTAGHRGGARRCARSAPISSSAPRASCGIGTTVSSCSRETARPRRCARS